MLPTGRPSGVNVGKYNIECEGDCLQPLGHLATTKSIGQELHGRLCAVTKASRPGDRHKIV